MQAPIFIRLFKVSSRVKKKKWFCQDRRKAPDFWLPTFTSVMGRVTGLRSGEPNLLYNRVPRPNRRRAIKSFRRGFAIRERRLKTAVRARACDETQLRRSHNSTGRRCDNECFLGRKANRWIIPRVRSVRTIATFSDNAGLPREAL